MITWSIIQSSFISWVSQTWNFTEIDPENNFVEAFGRNITGEETAKRIMGHIKDWEQANKGKKSSQK
jgi:hypothetical protein